MTADRESIAIARRPRATATRARYSWTPSAPDPLEFLDFQLLGAMEAALLQGFPPEIHNERFRSLKPHRIDSETAGLVRQLLARSGAEVGDEAWTEIYLPMIEGAAACWSRPVDERLNWRDFRNKLRGLVKALHGLRAALGQFSPQERDDLAGAALVFPAKRPPGKATFPEIKARGREMPVDGPEISVEEYRLMRDGDVLIGCVYERYSLLLSKMERWSNKDTNARKYLAVWEMAEIWWNLTGLTPGLSNNLDSIEEHGYPPFQRFLKISFNLSSSEGQEVTRRVIKLFAKTIENLKA